MLYNIWAYSWDAGVVSVAGDLRIFETPDVSDLLFVCSNNHFISFHFSSEQISHRGAMSVSGVGLLSKLTQSDRQEQEPSIAWTMAWSFALAGVTSNYSN